MVSESKKSGTYCLIIEIAEKFNIKIGKIGNLEFEKGFYVYVGSALNSLVPRINRHLSQNKKIFWHIDYLLNSKNSRVKDVIYIENPKKWECDVATNLARLNKEVKGFGCSDCKCKSHLFYFEEFREAKSSCLKSFEKLDLKPRDLNDFKIE